MNKKNLVRKKFYSLRKKKYFEINKFFFTPFLNLIKSKFKKKNFKIALYYPSSFTTVTLKTVNAIWILSNLYFLAITVTRTLREPS